VIIWRAGGPVRTSDVPGFFLLSLPCLVRDPPLRPEGRVVRAPARVVGRGRCGYVQRNYSFMPANAALRCQSNKAARSSRARGDGVIGADL
jgi:hypothetical protein